MKRIVKALPLPPLVATKAAGGDQTPEPERIIWTPPYGRLLRLSVDLQLRVLLGRADANLRGQRGKGVAR
jgi:hypothetical protein